MISLALIFIFHNWLFKVENGNSKKSLQRDLHYDCNTEHHGTQCTASEFCPFANFTTIFFSVTLHTSFKLQKAFIKLMMSAVSDEMQSFMDNYEFEILAPLLKKKKTESTTNNKTQSQVAHIPSARLDMSRVKNCCYVSFHPLPTLSGGFYFSLRHAVAFAVASGNITEASKRDHARLKTIDNPKNLYKKYLRTFVNAYAGFTTWDGRAAGAGDKKAAFTQLELRALAFSEEVNKGHPHEDGLHIKANTAVVRYMKSKAFVKYFHQQYHLIHRFDSTAEILLEYYTIFGKPVAEQVKPDDLYDRLNHLNDTPDDPKLEEFCCGVKISVVKTGETVVGTPIDAYISHLDDQVN